MHIIYLCNWPLYLYFVQGELLCSRRPYKIYPQDDFMINFSINISRFFQGRDRMWTLESNILYWWDSNYICRYIIKVYSGYHRLIIWLYRVKKDFDGLQLHRKMPPTRRIPTYNCITSLYAVERKRSWPSLFSRLRQITKGKWHHFVTPTTRRGRRP